MALGFSCLSRHISSTFGVTIRNERTPWKCTSAPDVQAKLDRLTIDTGRPANDLLQDALVGYFHEMAELRRSLDSRYDDMKSGRAHPFRATKLSQGFGPGAQPAGPSNDRRINERRHQSQTVAWAVE